jgi:RNA polymerase sigma-70 factor (ECF subfamily)
LKYRQDKVLLLLDQHGEQLHRLLARLIRCEHTTRDLMQELFIKLSCSRGFDKADNPYAYAWKSATNLAFRWHQQKKVKIESLESVQLTQESNHDALTEMIQQEQLQRVLQITASFKELARNVIVMRFIEQQSYEEIAVRLGKNPDYLRALCSKTLKRLRNRLGHQLSDHTDKEVCYD